MSPTALILVGAIAFAPSVAAAQSTITIPPQDSGYTLLFRAQGLWGLRPEQKRAALAAYQDLLAYERSLGDRYNHRLLGQAEEQIKQLQMELRPDGRLPAGDLPVGRFGSTRATGYQQTATYFLDVQPGRRYVLNGFVGRYTRQGDTLVFTGGALDGATATLVCRQDYLWFTVHFPNQKATTDYGYMGAAVCTM